MPLTACSTLHVREPEELAGTVTWSMTREYQDPAAPSRHEVQTTSVTMDVVLKVAQSRGGVRLYQAPPGNVVTLLHNQTAQRARLNVSVSQGDGAVTATTRYCGAGATCTRTATGVLQASPEV